MSDLPTDQTARGVLAVERLNKLADGALEVATRMLTETGDLPMFFILNGPEQSTVVFVDDLGVPAILGHPMITHAIREKIHETGALAIVHVADTWVTTIDVTTAEMADFKAHKDLTHEAYERARIAGIRRECMVCVVQSPIYLRVTEQFYRHEGDQIVLEEKTVSDSTNDGLTGSGRFQFIQFFDPPSDEKPN